LRVSVAHSRRAAVGWAAIDPLATFLEALRPLLREQGAKAAYIVGSWARGEADEWSDVDDAIVGGQAAGGQAGAG
jgi:predicted nucleotidyltransferase